MQHRQSKFKLPPLPLKLQIPFTDVHFYVEGIPDGVKLTTVSRVVDSFGRLSTKDKDKVLNVLNDRGKILVFQARSKRGVNLTTFLRHIKYGHPKDIPGYIYPLPKDNQKSDATSPKIIKSVEKDCMKPITTETPESLRKRAEELLKAAEDAENARNGVDLFNKKLGPVKLEVCQAVGALQRKTDEFIDCLDAVNKAVQKLKELSA